MERAKGKTPKTTQFPGPTPKCIIVVALVGDTTNPPINPITRPDFSVHYPNNRPSLQFLRGIPTAKPQYLAKSKKVLSREERWLLLMETIFKHQMHRIPSISAMALIHHRNPLMYWPSVADSLKRRHIPSRNRGNQPPGMNMDLHPDSNTSIGLAGASPRGRQSWSPGPAYLRSTGWVGCSSTTCTQVHLRSWFSQPKNSVNAGMEQPPGSRAATFHRGSSMPYLTKGFFFHLLLHYFCYIMGDCFSRLVNTEKTHYCITLNALKEKFFDPICSTEGFLSSSNLVYRFEGNTTHRITSMHNNLVLVYDSTLDFQYLLTTYCFWMLIHGSSVLALYSIGQPLNFAFFMSNCLVRNKCLRDIFLVSHKSNLTMIHMIYFHYLPIILFPLRSTNYQITDPFCSTKDSSFGSKIEYYGKGNTTHGKPLIQRKFPGKLHVPKADFVKKQVTFDSFTCFFHGCCIFTMVFGIWTGFYFTIPWWVCVTRLITHHIPPTIVWVLPWAGIVGMHLNFCLTGFSNEYDNFFSIYYHWSQSIYETNGFLLTSIWRPYYLHDSGSTWGDIIEQFRFIVVWCSSTWNVTSNSSMCDLRINKNYFVGCNCSCLTLLWSIPDLDYPNFGWFNNI